MGVIDWFMVIMFLLFGVQVFIFASMPEVQTLVEQEEIFRINCSSDSMGLILNCNDKVTTKKIGDEKLSPGKIYIYKNEKNQNVIHRLVFCVDIDCNVSVFKGDNNLVGEQVLRENITHEVKEIKYQ